MLSPPIDSSVDDSVLQTTPNTVCLNTAKHLKCRWVRAGVRVRVRFSRVRVRHQG